ncbi:MAG: CapA family protein [Leptospirales bacterium]|nr:CapA family protein [Leptospirales bacterium]
MKSKWVTFISAGIIVLGCVLVLTSLPGRDPDGSPENEVLLVQTGWTSEAETIGLAELQRLYCSGQLAATETAGANASRRFGCNPKANAITPAAFYPNSKNRLILVSLPESIPQMKHIFIDGISFFKDSQRYPLTAPAAGQIRSQVSHFILTGVSALTRYTGKSADANGPNILSQRIKPYFADADYVHVSNEVSFTNPCVFAPGTRFCSKEAHFQAFKDIRANVVELTGNHNRDFGNESFMETYKWFQKNGLKAFGGGRTEDEANQPLILPLKSGTLALIGFNELCPLGECASANIPGANRYNADKARSAIANIRKKYPGAFIIATVQFGEVNSYQPTANQRAISNSLLDFGADLVYGSQAHQVQQMEFSKGKILLHGLGNFFFDQTHTFGLRQGYFMNFYFFKGKLVSMQPVFTWIDEKYRPVPADAAQTKQIKESIYSDSLLYK